MGRVRSKVKPLAGGGTNETFQNGVVPCAWSASQSTVYSHGLKEHPLDYIHSKTEAAGLFVCLFVTYHNLMF